MPRNGRLIEIIYDIRPLNPDVVRYTAKVVKQTKTGFKVQNLDKPGLYEDVLFLPRWDGQRLEYASLGF